MFFLGSLTTKMKIGRLSGNGGIEKYMCMFFKKTDSEVKILKKANAGSFYGVIDDQNDP